PQIAALLRARDETVMAWRRRRRSQVLEDLRLEITSSLNIDLDTQLALIDRVRGSPGDSGLPRVPALPPLAAGWEAGCLGCQRPRPMPVSGCRAGRAAVAAAGRSPSGIPSAWRRAWRSPRR